IVQDCKNHLESLVTSSDPAPVVEVSIFHAEVHTPGSNYTLTLNGFQTSRSTCTSTCGDGIVTAFEVCDDGDNDGSYGGCMPGCQALANYCGDGAINGDEACDDGTLGNDGDYDGCNADCTRAPYCGDGVPQPGISDEECDDGNGFDLDLCSNQ